jgi:hypothetical protein
MTAALMMLGLFVGVARADGVKQIASAGGAPGVARSDSAEQGALYQIGGGFQARITRFAAGGAAYAEELDDYGYDGASPVAPGMFLFAAYRGAPLADVGVQVDYAYSSHGHPGGAEIAMRTHMRQLGVYARPRVRLHRRVDLGLRLEAGVIHTDTILRQQSLRVVTPYTRAQGELLIEGESIGMSLQVGYMRAFAGRVYEPYLAPPTGGPSFAIGVYRRL